MAPLLEARGIRAVRLGRPVLSVEEFSLGEREFLSLVGPNGSGKTTLILSLLRLIALREGTILFRGADVRTVRPVHRYRQNFAAVFQEPLLLNTTVYNNVAEGLRIRKRGGEETEASVHRSLERFGISGLRDRNARGLSAGESQRVSLARAFAVEPEVLFLDEPFSSLDAPSKELILRDVESALGESQTAVVMATHDMAEALRLSDRIAVMGSGRILQAGPPDELMRHPADEFVASFFGYETILRGAVEEVLEGSFLVSAEGRTVEIAGSAAPGSDVTFSLSPESILISREPLERVSARNRFAARIDRIIPAGFYFKVHLNCGFPLVSYITGHSMGLLDLREGEEVHCAFKSTAVRVLQMRGLQGGGGRQ
ncbi:MAG: ABC transporter ATP-binding protein [Spirochaetes bacterium]|nr:ABC transporter ATP-binding protein [Spirochaetota bacterium]